MDVVLAVSAREVNSHHPIFALLVSAAGFLARNFLADVCSQPVSHSIMGRSQHKCLICLQVKQWPGMLGGPVATSSRMLTSLREPVPSSCHFPARKWEPSFMGFDLACWFWLLAGSLDAHHHSHRAF